MFSKEYASVKGSLFLLQKAPSIRPLSFFSYAMNGSCALLARFGKNNSVSNNSLRYNGIFIYYATTLCFQRSSSKICSKCVKLGKSTPITLDSWFSVDCIWYCIPTPRSLLFPVRDYVLWYGAQQWFVHVRCILQRFTNDHRDNDTCRSMFWNSLHYGLMFANLLSKKLYNNSLSKSSLNEIV